MSKEFDLGERDSQNGVPARDNASDDYIEGYGLVYECDARHADLMANIYDEVWGGML